MTWVRIVDALNVVEMLASLQLNCYLNGAEITIMMEGAVVELIDPKA